MRSQPVLLAETPRAGIHGHRFIIPTDLKMSAAQVESFIRRAAEKSEGKDYLAADHLVKQQLANGAIRTGNETIILANIKVGALSNERKDKICNLLKRRLADFDELIAKIDWQAGGRQTSVSRPELNDWLDTEELQNLPVANLIEITPLHAVIAGILLGLMAGTFILFLL